MTDVVADAYATMANFRLYLRQTATTDATDPDTHFELIALEAAARAIERSCNRLFTITAANPTARAFTPHQAMVNDPIGYSSASYPFASSGTVYPYSWYRHYVLPIDDVADTTGLTVAFDSTGNGDYTNTTTAFRVGPRNAPARGLPYSRIIFNSGTYPPIYEESVLVTCKWGWTAIPTTIENANLLQAERFFKRRDAWFGIAGSPDLGNEVRLLAQLDPDVKMMVAKYRRNWGVV